MDIIYKIFGFIFSINMIILIGTVIVINRAIHFYRAKRFGGDLLDRFKHKSSTQTLTVSFGLLVNVFMLLHFANAPEKILILYVILFNTFMIIIGISAFRKIEIYENGIYETGKFTKWSQMTSLKETREEILKIEIKNKRTDQIIIDMRSVERSQDLRAFLTFNYEKSQ
ncbi:hypothetical protein RH915_04860 [Serpentinicella sp. ANB-PHB4]|uniref:hypothetical protein n=1 Tax=Serpentinicella sp. ANB-PHB4 TaxID=3074076 RepID=UPI00285BEE6B|nr:hypothetical protein [Serpentinicella sp. ANB-PHB4]MDR5658814.1 hypothetical protein [Serpentinicella sp. ANB-PHB4]